MSKYLINHPFQSKCICVHAYIRSPVNKNTLKKILGL